MHLQIEELLALRDGEAAPEAVAHVKGCARCAAEVEHLRAVAQSLAELPTETPSVDRWPEIRAAIAAEPSSRFGRRWALAAAAAVAAIFVGVAALLYVSVDHPGMGTAAKGDGLEELIAASQQLESVLQGSELETRVMNSRDAARIVLIEDHIAVIDARLAGAEQPVPRQQAVHLWLDRVELLDALVELQGPRTYPPAFQRASYQ